MSEEELKVFWDGQDPLKPIESEPSTANTALHDYAHMGYGRSLRQLSENYQEQEEAPTKSFGTLAFWSKTYDWGDRVSRWEELEHQKDERAWRERRDELRKQEWDNFARLQEIVTEMLQDVPKFIKRHEKLIEDGTPEIIDSHGTIVKRGKPNTKVVTLQIDTNAIIKFIRTASDIGRRAAEMDKSYMAKIINDVDFSKLTPEQIARVAEGEHILDILGIRK
jgi:hypothetical protein